MNLIPAFEIGLWNAWIFMPLYFLITYVPGYMINREKVKRASSFPPYTKKGSCPLITEKIYLPEGHTTFWGRECT